MKGGCFGHASSGLEFCMRISSVHLRCILFADNGIAVVGCAMSDLISLLWC